MTNSESLNTRNPGEGSLGGTLSVTAIDGVATFSGLTLDVVGNGYKIKATTGDGVTVITRDFNVLPARLTVRAEALKKLHVQTSVLGRGLGS